MRLELEMRILRSRSFFSSLFRSFPITAPLLLLLVPFVNAQPRKTAVSEAFQNTEETMWVWAKDVVADEKGFVYVTGDFAGEVQFGATRLTSKQSGGFLVKYAPSGELVWAKRAGNTGSIWYSINAMTVDLSGNLLITGRFKEAVSFEDTTITSPDGFGMFLTKYAPDGKLLSVLSSSGSRSGVDVTVDALGNTFLLGTFGGTITLGDTTLTNGSKFLAKYTSSGSLDWAVKGAGGFLTGVATDASGNSYIAGDFNCTVTLGDTTLANFDTTRADPCGHRDPPNTFLAKYTSSGALAWATKLDQQNCRDIEVDASGSIFVIGADYLDLYFGLTTHSNMSLTKHTPEGEQVWEWNGAINFEHLGDIGTTGGNLVTFGNKIFVAGEFRRRPYGTGLFLAAFTNEGELLWAAPKAVPEFDIDSTSSLLGTVRRVLGMAVDEAGDLYLTGSFWGILPFMDQWLVGTGESDSFAAKFTAAGESEWVLTARQAPDDPNLAPSPFTLTSPDEARILRSETPTFLWQSSADSDPIHYMFYLGVDSLFNDVSPVVTRETRYSLTEKLEEDQIYWWRVEAHDPYGMLTSPETRSFRIDTSPLPPSVPSVIAPANGEVLGRDTLTFTWSRATDPDPYDEISYRLLIAEDPDLSDRIHSVETADTTFTLSDLPEDQTYYWRVDAIDLTGLSSSTSVSAFEIRALTEVKLDQNFPNPFRAGTTIRFGIPRAASVRIRVYDVSGREVATLLDERREPGWHEVGFEAFGLPSGIYFCRLEAGGARQIKTIVLVR